MFNKFEFFIAFKYLKSKRKEKFISITALFSFIGIMLGVATLIVVMSVMNGFREELINKILGVNAHITIYPRNESKLEYKNIISTINSIANVETVTPIIENQAMVVSSEKALGTLVKSIQYEDFKKKTIIFDSLNEASVLNENEFNNESQAVIGFYLAQALNVAVGDEIKIISPEINTTIIGSIPRTKTYKIVAIFNSGMYEYDNNVIFIPFKLGQIHFNQKQMASSIEILLKDMNSINNTINNIHNNLKEQKIDYFLVDWKNANASLISALNVERNVMFLILTLIILIASFNIISSLTMLVMDKNKQIALLKTIGVSSNSILRIFFICGTFIGFIGTGLGVLLGTLFASNIENIRNLLNNSFNSNLFDPTIYFLSQLPSKVYYSDVVLITSMSLLIAFLATIYPALKASKTDPVEVLRYE